MRVIKIIGSIVVVILVVILLAIYLLPPSAHMERSILIEAPPEKIYRDLCTFRNFNEWSPWAQIDPEATYLYEGPEYGVGARISWKSTSPDIGNGAMEIVEVVPDQKVVSMLNFDEYGNTPYATFTLLPTEEGTRVTWAYDEYDVKGFGKIFLLGIDGFLGRDWESALQALKARVEKAPDFSFPVRLSRVVSTTYLAIQDSSANDPAMISTKMARGFGRLMAFLTPHGLEQDGYPVAIYPSMPSDEVTFICGVPISELPDEVMELPKDLTIRSGYGGLVVEARYTGDYQGLDTVHNEIRNFTDFYQYEVIGDPWEVYVTDPMDEPDPSRWKTFVYYPVR